MKNFSRFLPAIIILVIAIILRFGLENAPFLTSSQIALLGKISEVLWVISISFGIIIFIRRVKRRFLKNYDIDLADNLKSRKVHTQYNILEKILISIVVIISLAVILMLFDNFRRMGVSLFASAGIAGLILGLAAQKVLGGILAGLQLAITQPIRIDDVVIVENEWGWIEEINLTYVVVRIWDKRRLVVPSSYFIEKPFQNWTRTSADILGTVFIYTDYTMPVDALRTELTRLLASHPNWDKNVNVLQVTDAREQTLEIRALMSSGSSPKAWDLRVFIREKLIEFIQKEYPESLPRTRVVFPESKNIPTN